MIWDQLVSAVCRPYRVEYQPEELLGGASGKARLGSVKIRRTDFVITNSREQRLQCSFWEKEGHSRSKDSRLPCVIYCHCNSGSRLDAIEAIATALPLGIRVFSLDFAGSGISDGDYVTLGANEVEDLAQLVQFIRQGGHTSTIALWGRSMGAVTALLYAERDPSIAGMVLDSPFSKLTDLMWELVEQQRIPLRKYLGGTALKLLRRSVKKRAGFDINDLSPIEHASKAFIPALFGHATNDSFVSAEHTKRLAAVYGGDHEALYFPDCDHNSARPQSFYGTAANFINRVLRLPGDDLHHVAFDWPDAAHMGQTHSSTRPLHDLSQDEMEQQLMSVAQSGSLNSDKDIDRLLDEEDQALQRALEMSMADMGVHDQRVLPTHSRDGSSDAASHAPGSKASGKSGSVAHRDDAIKDSSAQAQSRELNLREQEDAMVRAAIEASLADMRQAEDAASAEKGSAEAVEGSLSDEAMVGDASVGSKASGTTPASKVVS